MKKFALIVLFVSTTFLPGDVKMHSDAITQYSTIDALLGGIYDGDMSLNDLKQYGDFGLGTFNGLDGEMIELNGKIFQVNGEGKAIEPDLKTKTPFAFVKFFKSDYQFNLHAGMTVDSLEKMVDNLVPTQNIFYAFKITGKFKSVTTRSFPPQSKPYKPMKEIANTQHVFNFTDTEGTVVGYRSPAYVSGINVPGYHLHFLTKDCKAGGHVLNLEIENGVIEIDESLELNLLLPKSKEFYNADLTADKQAELKKIEK